MYFKCYSSRDISLFKFTIEIKACLIPNAYKVFLFTPTQPQALQTKHPSPLI